MTKTETANGFYGEYESEMLLSLCKKRNIDPDIIRKILNHLRFEEYAAVRVAAQLYVSSHTQLSIQDPNHLIIIEYLEATSQAVQKAINAELPHDKWIDNEEVGYAMSIVSLNDMLPNQVFDNLEPIHKLDFANRATSYMNRYLDLIDPSYKMPRVED